ncbi:MAG: hypothetical protein IKC56_02755 [Clostridia bacterium]|nr:hypothetical protein [Clostridia bacterium]
MNKSKLKYLALPLCLSLCLVGCGKGEKLPKENVAETNVAVETVYDLIQPVNEKVSLASSLTVKKDTVVEVFNDVLLLKNVDKDTMNNVTETYQLYDEVANKVLLTLKHTYADGAYNNDWYTDEYGNEWKKPTEMKVEVIYGAAPYLQVTTYQNTRIAEEVLEKEDNNDGYVTTQKVAFYGLDGKEIAKFDSPVNVFATRYGYETATLTFGNVMAELNCETGEVIKTWNAEKETKIACFDYVGKNYGVYLEAEYGMYGAIESYTKSGKMVMRYPYDSAPAGVFPLNNGNVLVQYMDVTNGVKCDVIEYGQKYYVRTLLVDTLSGKVTQVECDYLFMDVYTKDTVIEELGLENAKVTDATFNVGVAVKMEGKDVEAAKQEIVFMNSALEISLIADVVHPEMLDMRDLRVLADGNYALPVQNGFASYVILDKQFNTVRYLPQGAEVFDSYIVLSDGVYSLDMVRKYSFDTDESFVGMIGDTLIVEEHGSHDPYNYDPYNRVVFVNLARPYDYEQTFYDNFVEEYGEDYVLLQDTEDKEFTLVNAKGNTLLTSANKPVIMELSDGSRLVSVTLYNGETEYYSWEVEIQEDGGDAE